MRRSLHSSTSGGENINVATSSRTSKQIWLDELDPIRDTGSETAFKISLKIRNATNMNCFAGHGSEQYQIANYGIGGQYSKHYDTVGEGSPFMDEGFELEGSRIQTFMAYLSDVEVGGATAFPLLGLAVWPKKGDAITWYNIHRNGFQDKLTMHGGCPVIKGDNNIVLVNKRSGNFLLQPKQSIWPSYALLWPKHNMKTEISVLRT